MRLPLGALATWFALALVLTLALRHPQAAIAPAALTPAHSNLERDCLACHVLGRGAPDARCTTCHPIARIGLFTSRGEPIATPNVKTSLHQRLKETRCAACHIEHPGSRRAVTHAGFAHGMLSPQDLKDCAACHTTPGDALHRGVTESCVTCHSTDHWKPAAFEHDRYWPLDRDHSVACATCHPGNALAGYTCYGCHEHSPESMVRKHGKEGVVDLDRCARCHKSPRDHEGGEHRGDEGGRRDRDSRADQNFC
jgi:hypothetical protein